MGQRPSVLPDKRDLRNWETDEVIITIIDEGYTVKYTLNTSACFS